MTISKQRAAVSAGHERVGDSLIIMCSNDELRTEYEDAGDRLWHLVSDAAGATRALCGATPASGWAGIGLIATCVRCTTLAKRPETGRRPAGGPA